MYHSSDEPLVSHGRINIPSILEVLLSPEQQHEHDDAYDTLDLLDYSYAEYASALYHVVQNADAYAFARWYALEALNIVTKEKQTIVPLLLSVLKDKDRHLSDKAWSILMSFDPSSLYVAIPTLVSMIKDRKSYISNQATAFIKLARMVGLTKATKLVLKK